MSPYKTPQNSFESRLLVAMEESTSEPSQLLAALDFSPHRKSYLRSRTYSTLIRILSYCHQHSHCSRDDHVPGETFQPFGFYFLEFLLWFCFSLLLIMLQVWLPRNSREKERNKKFALIVRKTKPQSWSSPNSNCWVNRVRMRTL